MRTMTNRLKAFLSKKTHALFINGDYVPASSEKQLSVLNPANEEVIGHAALAVQDDVHKAVAAARKAFAHNSDWQKMSPDDRSRLLNRFSERIDEERDSLAQLITLENGKLLRDSYASDVQGAVQTFRYYAGWASKIEGEALDVSQKLKGGKQSFAFTRREPIGVVAAIVPWNFPLSIAAWKLAPALAAGCTVVLKPSEETPLSALMLAELAMEAGFPKGVFNVVTGDGKTTGACLTAHPDIDKVSFTGSVLTGKEVGKTAMGELTEVSLELGGKSPAIVFDDAEDLTLAAKGVANGIFRNQGQVCVAGSRVYIQKKVFDKVLADICHIAEKMKMSHGFDETADLGPLISEAHLKKVCGYIDTGINEGAVLAAGGKRTGNKGWFLRPTIFSAENNRIRIVQEEIFGPVLVAVPFDDMSDVLQKANDNAMGLAATVWTQDVSKAMTMVQRLQAGVVYVNSPVRSDPNLPLGGYKQSGIGRELGKAGLYAYTALKSVNIIF